MSIKELKNENDIIQYLISLDERNQDVIALDIEGEFNLHCYGEHLCLVQIYDRQDEVIIDPFRFKSLRSLNMIFGKRDLLKIMYDAAGDASLLKNECNIRLNSVLDLRPAVILLEYEKQRLSDILTEELGSAPINKKKFQTYNWMKRPIDKEALEYAMHDVRYLFELKDKLIQRIIDKGLIEAYIFKNLMVQNIRIKDNKKERHKRVKGFGRLSKQQQALFEKVFYVRDEFARKLDMSPHNLFANSDLLALCQGKKTTAEDISKRLSKRTTPDTRRQLSEKLVNVIIPPDSSGE